jgi:hypothetical protein
MFKGQYFGAIDHPYAPRETGINMARYSAFLGRKVEVHYRAGDILLPASGTFVADSGRSIFLEQHLEQRGQMKHFRWEIPYRYIVTLEEKPEAEVPASESASPSSGRAGEAKASGQSSGREKGANSSSAAARASAADPVLPPLRNRPKTA